MSEPLFLRACRGEATRRIPVWIMRQAGRYLPEYQELRARHSFLDLCRTPELAREATLQPIRRFGFDAAILFSDILIPFEPMGLGIRFDDSGPHVTAAVRSRADVARLKPLDTRQDLPFVREAIRLTSAALGETPLIGFSGAPFTLATYAIESGSSKRFASTKSLLFSEPDTAHSLFRHLTDAVIDYLSAQIEAGAAAYQLFDTWGGVLSEADYRRFALPYLSEIFTKLRPQGVPGILYVNDGAHLFAAIHEAGSDVVGVDWRADLRHARRSLPNRALQGNLDPAVLLASKEAVRVRTQETLAAGAAEGGYVFNLGHGILPDTPVDRVETLVATVRAFRRTPSDPAIGAVNARGGRRGGTA